MVSFLNASAKQVGEPLSQDAVVLVLTREELNLVATVLEKLAKKVQSELERPKKASRRLKTKNEDHTR